MTNDQTVATVLLGVLLYKSLDLVVIREKVRQTFRRLERAQEAGTSISGMICDWVRKLEKNPETWIMSFFLMIAAVLGLFQIISGGGTSNSPSPGSFKTSLAVSLVTILASIYIGILNIVVERTRALIEKRT